MARDALGWRCKFAVVAPSTNTIVQPDMEALRPEGVTNHHGRIYVPDMTVASDEDFVALVEAIGRELHAAVDHCMTCAPDHLIMGMSALMFWDGRAPSETRMNDLADHAGVPVTAGSFACEAALNAYGGVKRIGVISPYMPVSDRNVTLFFEECGFAVETFRGLRCPSPVAIAEVPPETLRREIMGLDSDRVDAWVQVGTNLSMVRLALELEAELGKPVVAINAATYWAALRAVGIADRFEGWGPLFAEH